MTATRAIALFALAAIFASLVYGQQKPSANVSAEQEILKKYREWEAGIVKGDYSSFERDATSDYTCITREGELLDKQACLAGLKASSFQSWKCEQQRVRVHGNVAIVTGRVTINGTFNGKDTSGVYRSTETQLLQDGWWRLAATQFTTIAQP